MNLKVKPRVEHCDVMVKSEGVNINKTDGRIKNINLKVKLEVECFSWRD